MRIQSAATGEMTTSNLVCDNWKLNRARRFAEGIQKTQRRRARRMVSTSLRLCVESYFFAFSSPSSLRLTSPLANVLSRQVDVSLLSN